MAKDLRGLPVPVLYGLPLYKKGISTPLALIYDLMENMGVAPGNATFDVFDKQVHLSRRRRAWVLMEDPVLFDDQSISARGEV